VVRVCTSLSVSALLAKAARMPLKINSALCCLLLAAASFSVSLIYPRVYICIYSLSSENGARSGCSCVLF
jgi:hypothetical protein